MEKNGLHYCLFLNFCKDSYKNGNTFSSTEGEGECAVKILQTKFPPHCDTTFKGSWKIKKLVVSIHLYVYYFKSGG